MFFDEAGWGQQKPPSPKRVITPRQERVIMRLLLANVLFMLIAPIGSGTIVEGVVAIITSLHR